MWQSTGEMTVQWCWQENYPRLVCQTVCLYALCCRRTRGLSGTINLPTAWVSLCQQGCKSRCFTEVGVTAAWHQPPAHPRRTASSGHFCCKFCSSHTGALHFWDVTFRTFPALKLCPGRQATQPSRELPATQASDTDYEDWKRQRSKRCLLSGEAIPTPPSQHLAGDTACIASCTAPSLSTQEQSLTTSIAAVFPLNAVAVYAETLIPAQAQLHYSCSPKSLFWKQMCIIHSPPTLLPNLRHPTSRSWNTK